MKYEKPCTSQASLKALYLTGIYQEEKPCTSQASLKALYPTGIKNVNKYVNIPTL